MSQNFRFITLLALFLLTGLTTAQVPCVGDVERRTVITLALNVGSTEKETKRVTYTPPPGWYVRSHRVYCKKKFGHSSYTVTTVPPSWGWTSAAKASESYKALVDVAGQNGTTGLKGKVNIEQEQLSAEQQQIRSTHHALVVDATAKGEGLLRSGGGIDLIVVAELVYLGESSIPEKLSTEKTKDDQLEWVTPTTRPSRQK